MANKNTLEIIIKANATQAVAALNKLQTTVAKPFSGLQQQVGMLGDAFTSVTGISLGAAGAFAAVGMAASKASDFIKSSVAETVAYAQSVRELSYVLGINAEETSRIIQVADDYLISTEKLTTALRFAVKNGFEPSVESLAQLADQFNAIQDPNERAAQMVQIFGRNWSALVPLLKAGGAAIRENAAAIQEGLVLDDADVQSVFEYQQALDQLNDSVAALKTNIGMALVPALADVLSAFNQSATFGDQMSRSFEALNGVMERSNSTATALEHAFQMGFNVSPAGLGAIGDSLNAIEDDMMRVAEAERIFGSNWNVVYDAVTLGTKGIEQLSQVSGRTQRELQGLAQAQGEVADSAEEIAEKEKRAGDALKDYSKAITKLGLSTSQENALLEQFAANLGGIDATALIAANDMDLLDAALAANAITLGEYTAISLTAAQGTGELDDATRAYLDAQLAMAEGQKGITNSLEGTANAATLVRDQLVNVIGLAEQLRFAGPREVRTQIFEQLKSLLTDIDPSKAGALATGIKDIGLAFGVFNANDLAVAEAIPQFVEQLGNLQIDPTQFAEAVQGFLDAVRNTRMTGQPIDVNAILEQFKPTPEQVSALAEEYKDVVPQIQEAVLSSTDTGITLEANPILEQFAAKPEDIALIQESYEPVKAIPQELIDSWAMLTGEEGVSVLAQPVEQIAAAVGTLGENAAVAKDGVGGVATQTGIFADKSIILNEELTTLPSRVETLGKKAVGAYQPMRDLAVAIGDVARAAQTAGSAVDTLAKAIGALKDKTVTITANVVANDPLGLLGGGGGGGGGEYQPGPPTGRRARGGPVEKLKKYLVGEQGPELFLPATAGTIIPADVTQAAIIAAGTSGDAFGGNRGQTPAERAKNRRRPRTQEGGGGSDIPVVSGAVPQPTGPQFLGANLDAYLDLFQPSFSVDAPPPAPEPQRRAARSSDQGSGSSKFGRSRNEPMTAGAWRRQQQALQTALEQTYQPLGSNLFQPSSQGAGDLSTEAAAVATADTETERIGKTVTYNNYFPVQKLDDELDARDLARKVAAELARMPSR